MLLAKNIYIQRASDLNHIMLKMKFPREILTGDSVQIGEIDKIYGHKKSRTILYNWEGFVDFLVWRKDGVAAYELATVVDGTS